MNRSREIKARIAAAMKIIILHPDLKAALEGIQDCVDSSIEYGEVQSCTIEGEGGMGKSTLMALVEKEMPRFTRRDELMERTIIPVFCAAVPANATIRSLASILLEKLGDPDFQKGNTSTLTTKLCKLLKECETLIILLDEINHMVNMDARFAKLNKKLANWIKQVMNETNVPFCLVGTPGFSDCILGEQQYTRRLLLKFSLRPLNHLNGTLRLFLKAMATNIQKKLQLNEFPNLGNEAMTLRIFVATGGNISFIKLLVRGACELGLAKGDSVTEEDFKAAWQRKHPRNACLIGNLNPFEVDYQTLLEQFGGKE